MSDSPGDTSTPSPDPMPDRRSDEDPPLQRWRVLVENYSAARRALYAARAQLG